MRGLFFVIAMAGLLAGAPAASAEPLLPVRLNGRTVDLHPYYYAFPYHVIATSAEAGRLWYSESLPDGSARLRVAAWRPDSGAADLAAGASVTDVDLNRINFWRRAYAARFGGLIATADQDKRERTNLWLFAEGAQTPEKLTDADYIYNWTLSDDGRDIYYIARYGDTDVAEGCLERLRVGADGRRQRRRLLCDSDGAIPARLNSWSPLRADDDKVVFTALAEGDRNRPEIYAFDFAAGAARRLLEADQTGALWIVEAWRGSADFLFLRGSNLYRYDAEQATSNLLRAFPTGVSEVWSAPGAAADRLIIAFANMQGMTLSAFEVHDDRLIETGGFSAPLNPRAIAGDGDRRILGYTSTDLLSRYDLIGLDARGAILRRPLFAELDAVNRRLERCVTREIEYVSHDASSETQGDIRIRAHLFAPQDPPPPDRRLYAVIAFYGGANRYVRGFQALCELGITILSPSVRGDGRSGDGFERANDREKADAPIRDVIAGARYLSMRFPIASARQIGVWGFSHGGWAALRALSYAGPERFDFGFAMAGAGYFDFLEIVDQGGANIVGWISKEFGDVETQRDLLARLSPANHIDRIDAPVFLYHGENDRRIALRHTLSFAERLRAAGRDVDVYVAPAQGHRITGARSWHGVYRAMARFLERLPRADDDASARIGAPSEQPAQVGAQDGARAH